MKVAQAERDRRTEISRKYPELHGAETTARRSCLAAQQRAAAEQSRAHQPAAYQPPSQSRRGPSMGGPR
ncbi:hypothetical protein ACFC5T_40165 [Streptomyces sp. NPDC055961]|uniref:hypothetical protein n=1 Tax=Streptomyces sp. NPDC055961 TaxID=3345666 RepID=UPI0035DEFF97